MKCSTIRPLIFRRLDNELEVSELSALEKHLEGCPACRREASLLSIPQRIGQAIPALEPSPFFYQRLKARLQSEQQSITIWQIILGLSRHLVPGMAAISMALLSVFIYFQLRGPAVDITQVYETIFTSSADHHQRLFLDDQNEITDESVLSAIAEEELVRRQAPATDIQH